MLSLDEHENSFITLGQIRKYLENMVCYIISKSMKLKQEITNTKYQSDKT